MFEIFRQFSKVIIIRRLWLYLYLFKAIFAALLVLPFFMTVNAIAAPSPFSLTLLDHWDMSVIMELMTMTYTAAPALLMIPVVGAIIYVVIMQFLNGGIYFLMISRGFEKVDWKEFYGECGINFGAHIKITLVMLIIYSLLIPSGMFFINMAGLAGGNLIGLPAVLFALFKLLIMILILTAASIFSDSVRAACAAYPEKSIREKLKLGSGFLKLRLWRLLGIYIVTYVPFLIIWGISEWSALRVIILFPAALAILFEFVLYQLSSILRTGQKLWYLVIMGGIFRDSYPGRFLPNQIELPLGD
nr:hypothetical protein [candidate division Zixibacteria bacterium]